MLPCAYGDFVSTLQRFLAAAAAVNPAMAPLAANPSKLLIRTDGVWDISGIALMNAGIGCEQSQPDAPFALSACKETAKKFMHSAVFRFRCPANRLFLLVVPAQHNNKVGVVVPNKIPGCPFSELYEQLSTPCA